MAEPLRVAAEQLRRTFERTARELDERHENCTIARVCGSGIGVVGSGIAIVCGLAAGPVAIPAGALVASAFGGTGALIAGGAQVINIVLDRGTLEEAQRKLDTFKQRFNDVLSGETITGYNLPLLQAVDQFISVAGKGVSVAGGAVKIYSTYRNLGAEAASVPREAVMDVAKNKTIEYVRNSTNIVPNNVSCQFAENMFCRGTENSAACTVYEGATCRTAQQALAEAPEAVAGSTQSLGQTIAVANAALLAFSVYDLVCASVELYRTRKHGWGSRPGNLLREIVEALRSIENVIAAQQAQENQALLCRLEASRISAAEENRRLEENIRRMEEIQRSLDQRYWALQDGPQPSQNTYLPTLARYMGP